MGFKERFRRSRSFGPGSPPELTVFTSPAAANSESSFHTALDFNNDPTVTTPTGERRTRADARQRIRDGLFGPPVEDPGLARQYSRSPIKRQSTTPEAGLGVSATLKSPASPLQRRSSNVEELIQSLRDIAKTASPDEIAAIREALALPDAKAGKGDMAAIEESLANKDPRVSSLLRRKTLLRPGVATRSSPPNVLRKAQPKARTSPRTEPNQTWSEDMFVSSPLSKLAKLKDDSVQVSVTRCDTPSEANYPLGAYEPGSLRVTNGAASPEPSIASTHRDASGINLRRMHDYFTTADDSEEPTQHEAEEGDTWSHLSPTFQELDGQPVEPPRRNSNLPITSPGAPLPGTASPRLSRVAESPIIPQGHRLARTPTSASTSSETSTVSERTEQLNMYSMMASSNPFLPLRQEPALKNQHSASSMRRVHVGSQLRKSPSTEAPKANTGASKAPSDRVQAEQIDTSSSIPPSLDRLYSDKTATVQEPPHYAIRSKPPPVPSESSESDLACAVDSGYSSQASLQVKHAPAHYSTSSRPERDELFLTGPSLPLVTGASDADPSHCAPGDETVQRMPDAGNCLDLVAPNPSCGSFLKPANRHSQVLLPKPAVYEMPAKSLSMNNLAMDLGPRVSPASSAAATPEKAPKARKKLQKRRKSTVDERPLSINSAPDPCNIPCIPTSVAANYSRRMSVNPEMQNLERTYTSVSASEIYSDNASSLGVNDPANLRFPSPRPDAKGDGAWTSLRGRSQKRRSIGPDTSSPGFLQRLSRSRSKSKTQKDQDDPFDDEVVIDAKDLHVADFGTVAESLGSSPYELAMPSGPRNRFAANEIRHPHQITRPTSGRAKSKGMSEEEASRLAHQRSRDRQANLARFEREYSQSRGARRDSDPRRPVQVHNSSGDKGPRPRPSRPHSEVPTEIPPVPALPRARTNVPRPKSVHESTTMSSGAGIGDGISIAKDHVKPQGPEGGSMNRAKPAASDWDDSARSWRMRRKSIGEGLLRRKYEMQQEDSADKRASLTRPAYSENDLCKSGPCQWPPGAQADRSASSNERLEKFEHQTRATSKGRYYGSQAQARPGTAVQGDGARAEAHPRPMTARPNLLHPMSAARTASPTQSIRERAAVFERASAASGREPVEHAGPAQPARPRLFKVSSQGDSLEAREDRSKSAAKPPRPLSEAVVGGRPGRLHASKSLHNVSAFLRRSSSDRSSATAASSTAWR